jgi:hypothetical protein
MGRARKARAPSWFQCSMKLTGADTTESSRPDGGREAAQFPRRFGRCGFVAKRRPRAAEAAEDRPNQHSQFAHGVVELKCAKRFDASWEQTTNEAKMARDEHNKAAEHHENAAKAHRSAAEHHGKGDHAKGKEHANAAKQHSQTAHQQTDQAHSKSQQQK